MYLGILMVYIAFICFSLSLIALALFVIIFRSYNRSVNYEENVLEQLFGKDYLQYKQKVPKWIPKLF